MNSPQTKTLTEIAALLNRNPSGVLKRAKKLSLPYGKRPCMGTHDIVFRAAHTQALMDSYPLPAGEDWLTAHEVVRQLGLNTTSALWQRMSRGTLRIEARDLTGPGRVGRCTRYNPVDVAREAARRQIRPRSTPKGTLSAGEFATLMNTCLSTIHGWAHDGCPHGVLMSGFRYWRPAEVLPWLEVQPVPQRRKFATVLRAALAGQRAA